MTKAARPLLVLVSGGPACGKSTLARRLAQTLDVPLLARDTISEALADALDTHLGEQRRAVLVATFRVFYRLMADMLGTGKGLVADSNFHRGAAEDDLRPFLTNASTVILYVHAPLEVSFRRFVERYERGARHRSSFDAERISQIRSGQVPEAWERAQQLDLGVPTLLVDTTDGYVPALDDIVAFIRSAVSLGHKDAHA